jgi:hypothetical protein
VSLPLQALTLARELDGSAGGGYDKAVLWNDFEKITVRGQNKFYFVMREQGAASGHAAQQQQQQQVLSLLALLVYLLY